MSTDKLTIPKVAANGTQSRILKIIRDCSPISRTGIVAEGDLPHAAVSRAVSNLLSNKVVTEESLADTNGPRRKRGLRLSPDFGYCMAVEYSPRGIGGVILDMAYNAVVKDKEKVVLESLGRDEKIKEIKTFIEKLLNQASSLSGKCFGLAVVDPGIIDEKAGISLTASIMEHWKSVPIVKILEDYFNLPVMLLNTSMAKIRAVDRLELRNESGNLIYIEYGEGIACGLKMGAQYMPGQSNLAGEFGHLRITDNQVPCRCGGVGCLEAIAALPALAQNAKQAMSDSSDSCLADMKDFNGFAVLDAAAKGDRIACRIVDEAFEYLGRAVAGLTNILNPEIIMLDNTISFAGEESINFLKRSMRSNMLPSHCAKLDVRISSLNSHIGALGGAVAVLDYCLEV
ncbi:MAG: ROK family protein [Planctomycetota bacterium]